MNRIKSKLRLCAIVCIISVSGGSGGIGLTGCTVNETKLSDSGQTINQKPPVNEEPVATPTYLPVAPPPSPPRKPADYQEMHRSFTLRLKKKIEEREKEIALQPVEDLPDSASEIRLWYFPSHEKMRGIIFSPNDNSKPLISVNENSKEELYLDKEKLENLTKILEQSNIEKLKDTKTIEFTPSTGDSYLVYQIKSGREVFFKIYLANVGSNVKTTESGDLCDAAESCRKISELLSLNFNDCKCSLPDKDH